VAGRSPGFYRRDKRQKEIARKARQEAKRQRRQQRVDAGEKGPPIEELSPEDRPVTPGEVPEMPVT
jgi:hypothetical protein